MGDRLVYIGQRPSNPLQFVTDINSPEDVHKFLGKFDFFRGVDTLRKITPPKELSEGDQLASKEIYELIQTAKDVLENPNDINYFNREYQRVLNAFMQSSGTQYVKPEYYELLRAVKTYLDGML